MSNKKGDEFVLDFVSIETQLLKNTVIIYPEFIVKKSDDLMIRGKAFYAVWDEEKGFWSRNEDDVQRMVDKMLYQYASEHSFPMKELKLMSNFSSNKWSEWQKYCKSLPDNYHELDDKIIFGNTKVNKSDYVTRRLDYPMKDSPYEAYDTLMKTLYDPDERKKLEWAVGAIIAGDSKEIQKFLVLYGGPGTGKSTVLNIIQELFQGYCSVFESKTLGSNNNSFALEAFRENPLVAIEHDGDLSRIEDNTKINSIVSHEKMIINEKFKSVYSIRFHSFLFIGTNKPVRITDSKSGILRRLIDVSPSGRKIPRKDFDQLISRIPFEYPGIAHHCFSVYDELGPSYYDSYIPTSMMIKTNDFYNFIEDNYDLFKDSDDGLPLTIAWRRYKDYCEDAKVPYPMSMRLFKDEMKNYFREFHERYNGNRSVYIGFLSDKFTSDVKEDGDSGGWLYFDSTVSIFDDSHKKCLAQEANINGTPNKKWSDVSTMLSEIDTHKVHYVKIEDNEIVIDFDLKDDNNQKSYELNLKAANKWPPTYAELSKSGSGIHLHYIYDGDIDELSRIYDENIEIKVFKGNSSLRRMLTKCNDLPIATINSGLPLKEKKIMLNDATFKSEKGLRKMIIKNLHKEIHPYTRPSIDFIYKILEDANNQGLVYDLTDLRPAVQSFALSSTHQADYCVRMVGKMKFQSDTALDNIDKTSKNTPIIFFDVEVFPNLFIICWKLQGYNNEKVVQMINPTPDEVEALFKYRLVGFNVRRYDNHIIYARSMGYTNEQLFKLSQRIISGDRDAFFREAYNLSYTDIYDFLSSQNKMSLKKWEIKLGIHHQEFGLPWDRPVPKDKWVEAADYCSNDVIASEAVWDANQPDWLAREILAEWSGLTVNDTTNSHTCRIIVGTDRNPQSQYIYTDLSTIYPGYEYNPYGIDRSRYNEGTKIVSGKSIYMGEDPGEGGYAVGYPGIYYNVALLDVVSMHPHAAITLNVFGDEYTMKFKNIVDARVYIKRGDYVHAKEILPERLHKYLDDDSQAKKLANALKTAINSVYGLTSASFDNLLRDPRNKDNIVAKYGALFMITLKHEVQNLGYTVVHIKTDSIKIADADEFIISFVMEFAEKYGFEFEHEDTYEKICIVNDSTYIAKYANPYVDKDGIEHKWTATGTQFQVPYVFKTLFSKEPIEFKDLCETKSVSTVMYLDFNENLSEDEHDYRFVGKVGLFCPILPGCGGGILLRQSDDKYNAVTGTKKKNGKDVYRWMEAEDVKTLGKEDCIDRSYYNVLVDEAITEISKYGDFELFADNMDWVKVDETIEEGVPFDECVNPPEI